MTNIKRPRFVFYEAEVEKKTQRGENYRERRRAELCQIMWAHLIVLDSEAGTAACW